MLRRAGRGGICARPSNRSGQPVQPETEPRGSQLSGVFEETLVWSSVTDEVPAGSKLTLRIPPAPPSALLPVTWLLLSTSVAVSAASNVALAIPPPRPSGALFPETTVLFSVAVAWLSSPPPIDPSAVLPVSECRC